jgi:hypothetical protein
MAKLELLNALLKVYRTHGRLVETTYYNNNLKKERYEISNSADKSYKTFDSWEFVLKSDGTLNARQTVSARHIKQVIGNNY